jgi:hypothetical protein
MALDEGDFIRHRARPDWGIGQIRSRRDDRIDVQFAKGLVALKLSVAEAFLERVSKAEAALAGITPARRTGPAKTASGSRHPAKGARAVAPPPEPEEEEADEPAVDDAEDE